MSTLFKTLLTAAAGLAISTGAHAGALRDIVCNVDMYNLTGQTANDFHIEVGGAIQASDVLNIYRGSENPFPDVTVTDQPGGGVLVSYSGAEVRNRDAIHVGLRIPVMSGNPVMTDQYWTSNGAKLGTPSYYCNLAPASILDGKIVNTTGGDAWVQRRVLYQTDNVALDDLLRGGSASSVWNRATLIDTDLVQMSANAVLDYSFAGAGDGAYVMAYDVYLPGGSAGQRVLAETVLQGFNVVPEPGSLALLGSALLLGAGLRRRRAA